MAALALPAMMLVHTFLTQRLRVPSHLPARNGHALAEEMSHGSHREAHSLPNKEKKLPGEKALVLPFFLSGNHLANRKLYLPFKNDGTGTQKSRQCLGAAVPAPGCPLPGLLLRRQSNLSGQISQGWIFLLRPKFPPK